MEHQRREAGKEESKKIVMRKEEKEKEKKRIFVQLGLIILAALFFALSFPNPLFSKGLPFLAWFAYFPVILVIHKSGILVCIGWGAIYGCISYALFNYWLTTFHPLAGLFVYSLYLIYLAVVFLLLKTADILFPKRTYIVQWLIWLAYEYLRTKGFLGYSYGITGYSQWQMIPLIQIASITGVWGISALVTFPSFLIGYLLRQYNSAGNSKNSLIKEKIPALIWAAALIAALVFGVAVNKDFSVYPQAQIALIQHNTDPWEASRAPTSWQRQELYRKDLAILIQLSEEALDSNPETQLVVWPETAFIPRIYWHSTYRDDQNSWLIVKDLLDYLAQKDIPFLIGNDDARKDPIRNPDAEDNRIDYNAAMLFENGQNTQIYRKRHLVPMTEHFPYKKQLPFIYNALKKVDTTFWEMGEEETVFIIDDFSFSAPICFEDTFGYLSRNFVSHGADVLINLTNDAWANSLTSQYQHLSMAVFRAVENRRSMVRSTVTGQTCAIDPGGRIIAEAAPFTQAWIKAAVPIVKTNTFYTRFGDYLALMFVFISIFLLIFKAVWCKIKR